jgi:hypothetical protein
VVHIVVAGDIVDHYCLRFDREVVHIAVAVMVNNITSHNNMNHFSVKPQTVMVNNITSHSNMNNFSVKLLTVTVIGV